MIFRQWEIPASVLHDTYAALQSRRMEVVVLWTATTAASQNACQVRRCVVPRQVAGFTPLGEAFSRVDGAEISRVTFEAHHRREFVAAPLHSHPSRDVRMSDTDLHGGVVTHEGALSLIVPVYGRLGSDGLPGVNVYEREVRGWRLWGRAEIAERLRVVS